MSTPSRWYSATKRIRLITCVMVGKWCQKWRRRPGVRVAFRRGVECVSAGVVSCRGLLRSLCVCVAHGHVYVDSATGVAGEEESALRGHAYTCVSLHF